MEKDWTLVFSTGNLQEAQLIKALLEENEIPVVNINKKDSAYPFGEVEVYVKNDHVIKAKHLISSRKE
jgi:hypothetical protein